MVTARKSTKEQAQRHAENVQDPIPADDIAAKASRSEVVSPHFTNKLTVVRPIRRVNVDLTPGMLRQLDERAARLNISRQAVIKT